MKLPWGNKRMIYQGEGVPQVTFWGRGATKAGDAHERARREERMRRAMRDLGLKDHWEFAFPLKFARVSEIDVKQPTV